MIYIIIVIASFIISYIISYFIVKTRIKQINYQIEQENNQILNQHTKLKEKFDFLAKNYSELVTGFNDITQKKKIAENDFFDLTKQKDNINKEIMRQTSELKNIEVEKSNQKSEYLIYKEQLEEQKNKLVEQYNVSLQKYENDLLKIQNDIESAKNSYQSSIEAKIREEQLKNTYCIQMKELSKSEIEKIKPIIAQLKDPRPICKAVWEGYYRDPSTELLNRILDKKLISGIYKITNLTNQKIYIGQSVNLAERLKTHIKAGCGIDATNNQMYKDMQELGPENFSFEILEYCNKEELNSKEKFWIDYYSSQAWGYNETKGGSAVKK